MAFQNIHLVKTIFSNFVLKDTLQKNPYPSTKLHFVIKNKTTNNKNYLFFNILFKTLNLRQK